MAKFLLFNKYKNSIKSSCKKRSKTLLVIGIVGISIGTISKKVISYQNGGCIKVNQGLTFKS